MTIYSFLNKINGMNVLNSENICPVKNFNISIVRNS